MSRQVLLVARSVTHHAGHETIHRLAAEVGARLGVPARGCFLDGAEPSLHAALDAAAGAGEIVLVPTHLPPDRYLDTWIRRAVAHWRQTRAGTARITATAGPADPPALVTATAGPDAQPPQVTAGSADPPALVTAAAGLTDHPPRITVTAGLADQPALVAAIAEAIDGTRQEVRGTPGPFRSPAWSALPRHRRQVLVCRGPRCTAYGANDVAATLGARLAEHGLGDDDVLVTATGCLFPCNLGPVVVVHPDDVWYEHVDPARAARIADGHLRDGRPVDGFGPRPAVPR